MAKAMDIAETAHRYLTLLDLWGITDSPDEWTSFITNYGLTATFANAARSVVEQALKEGT